MIKIINEEEYNNGCYTREKESWDFPLEELDYLLEEHKGEVFLLKYGRLYEVIDNKIDIKENNENNESEEKIKC